VVVAEDCNTGYHDPSRNPKGSLAWDMSQIAFARRRYEGNRPGVEVLEIDHM
jgi:hypothetical protein